MIKFNDISSSDLLERRDFLGKGICTVIGLGLFSSLTCVNSLLAESKIPEDYNPLEHSYGMGINIKTCIGCGKCVVACKQENDVPKEPYFFRTWVERYTIDIDRETTVDSPNGGAEGFPLLTNESEILKSFFVPKLCNHCKNAPCVQVCPVGATYTTQDGVVLVDEDYCIGCRYCIQACPYGARFLDPRNHVAEKCTFCYHRIVKGLQPACVEVCPTETRIFGDTEQRASRLTRFFRFNEIHVLKGDLNTNPQVFYAGMDGEVR